jgi:hypothetical protein
MGTPAAGARFREPEHFPEVPIVRLGLLKPFPALLLLAPLALGCSDDHDHDEDNGDGHTHDDHPECMPIIEACHPKDVGEGRVNECHTIGHDGTAAECAEVEDECVAVCEAAPDPGGHEDEPDAG